MRLIKAVAWSVSSEFRDQMWNPKMLWESAVHPQDAVLHHFWAALAEHFFPEIAACEAQWDEWERTLPR